MLSQRRLSIPSKAADSLWRLTIFKLIVIFSKDSFIIPFIQLIKVFEVTRKGFRVRV